MYGIGEIDELDQQIQKNEWNADYFAPAAVAAQNWLLCFVNNRDPASLAYGNLRKGFSDDYVGKLILPLALALSITSPHTGAIFTAYHSFIDTHDTTIGDFIKDFSRKFEPEFQVDVVRAFQSINNPELFPIAFRAYRVTIENLRYQAVAWDDIDLFKNTLFRSSKLYRPQAFSALAFFESDPHSSIHQHLVQTEDDEKELFFHRIQRLRAQLTGKFQGGIEFLRPQGPQRATLRPANYIYLDEPTADQVTPLHKTTGFAGELLRDTPLIVREFFGYQADGLSINPANWHLVDEITQAFLSAGVDPFTMIAHGPCSAHQTSRPVTPETAMERLGQMNNTNLRFYQVMYKAYLEGLGPQQVLDNCTNPKAVVAAYQMTGDKTYLQAGNDWVRDQAMGSDLGL